MQRERKLYLTICDYNKNAVCDIYDNQSDISGQATDVYIDYERNGWKELSFKIPSVCSGENGDEPNFRTDYLVAEYKIRAITDTETDWFIISEPNINRSNFSKSISVTAPHVSILLKNKNMDLEFSDEEGNNVGTADQLLTTILEGSGWHVGTVAEFKEEDGKIKARSITGQAGTGALAFINKLCEAFEAKPVYHGDTQTVDLLPMNPYGKIAPENIPSLLVDEGKVIELCYDRNIHDLTKTINTENMVTRLYAYGSSGDLNGACTLQNAEHAEFEFVINETGSEYCFEDLNEKRYFFQGDADAGDKIIWSDMDITSKLYVWNDTKKIAYILSDKPSGEYVTLENPEYKTVQNKFPYLLGLKYYHDVGLLTDEKLQEIAAFQRTMPSLYQQSEDAALAYVEDEQELSRIGESNSGFLKLNVTEDYSSDSDGAKRIYIDDIAYRSDYDVAERRFFQWHVAKELKPNGDPVSGSPSVILVVHNTNPVTWDKVYVKRIYNQDGQLIQDEEGNPADFRFDGTDRPGSISVWSNSIRWDAEDRIYLFCTNSMSGLLGARQVEDEAVIENILNTTMDGSEKHPTYFVASNETRPTPPTGIYSWLYQYTKDLITIGTLYFCWPDKGDSTWRQVFVEHTPPAVVNNAYFYNLKTKVLSRGTGGKWVPYESAAEQRVANSFNKVFYYCRRRDMLYKGLYEYYYRDGASLPVANYAIGNDFAFYWTFTTDRTVTGQLKLDTIKGQVYQDDNIEHIVTSSVVPIDTVFYPAENELDKLSFVNGSVNRTTGAEEDSSTTYRSTNLRVWENTLYEYNLPAQTYAVFYTISLAYISNLSLTGSSGSTGTFTTPPNTRYVRFVSNTIPTGYVRVNGYDSKFYINDKPYNILTPVTTGGELIGINTLTKKFADLADKTYGEDLVMLRTTQDEIKTRDNALSDSLGDMLKDGRWQDANYIKGDEKRLYDETTDMLAQISMPEISYSFTYLDMYGVKGEHYYEEHETKWPDIQITDTAHLIDTESNTNCWAYFEKIHKCFDQEWKTTIEIDTKLTLAANHSFTDAIARIAEVAKQIKSKQPEYDRASNGKVSASRLEGAINLYNAILKSGSSNWYTDDNGNMIFESADGLSAMMLGGRGLGIANSKDAYGEWEFRTAATGYGITADEIYTGYLSAERIEANSITADKLMANVGQELDIGSNKALALFATVNGSRPSGTVKTTDGLIEIIAGYQSGSTTVPAQINVKSGGELNLSGGTVNISSTGAMDISSGAEFHLRSKGATSVDSTADGIYLGDDGINFGGGKFKMAFNGNTSTLNLTASYVSIGTPGNEVTKFSLDSNKGKIEIKADNEIDISSNKSLKLISNGGNILIGSGTKPFTIGADSTRAYIYYGRATASDTTHDGVYLGSDGLNIGKADSGYVVASPNGNVDVSGTIRASSLYIGGKLANLAVDNDGLITLASLNSNTQSAITKAAGITVDNNGKITLSALTQTTQDAITKAAGIEVDANGKVLLSAANFDSLGSASSILLTPTKIMAGSTGDIDFSAARTLSLKAGSVALTALSSTDLSDFNFDSIGNTTGIYLTPTMIKAGSTGDIDFSAAKSLSLKGGSVSLTALESTDLSDYNFDSLGSGTGIVITPTKILAGSTGDIDFSAAKSISLKAGSISIAAISDMPEVLTVPTGVTIADYQVKVYSGSNYINITNTGLYAKGTEIKLDDASNVNHVYLTSNGIDIKGARVTITDTSTGEVSGLWGRDDIVVMNPNETDPTKLWRRSVADIEYHMAGKTDWVLIKPYYNARIPFANGGTHYFGASSTSANMSIALYSSEGEPFFGNGTNVYYYTIKMNIAIGTNQAIGSYKNFHFALIKRNNTTGQETYVYVESENVYGTPVNLVDNGKHEQTGHTMWRASFVNTAIEKTQIAISCGTNLCEEGYSILLYFEDKTSGHNLTLTGVEMIAECDATKDRVPCTVYYYSP